MRDRLELPRAQARVLGALMDSTTRIHTRDLASRCGLLLNEARWACSWLAHRGLISETKRLVPQQFGDKQARRPVSFWSMTEPGRLALAHPAQAKP